MRTLTVIAFIAFVGLGEWIVDTLQPFFWPLAATVLGLGALWGVVWAFDHRPGRCDRDAEFARRHQVQR